MYQKYQINTPYHIGTSYVMTFNKGHKCPQDYLIYWNGSQQFDDDMLFSALFNNIACSQCAYNFIKHFYCATQFITFNERCIKTNILNVGDVIGFVNNLLLADELKLCLASMIFRCDIDNINYECPRLNGCVRHFVQILMVFGYKFDISQWQMPKLNNYLSSNHMSIENIPKLISSIGFPRNKYEINTNDFRDMYQTILPQLRQL